MAADTIPTEQHAFQAAPTGELRPVSRGELVRYDTDQYSLRRLIKGFLADVVNPENAVLRRERSADGYYHYPYGLFDEMLQKDLHLSARWSSCASRPSWTAS